MDGRTQRPGLTYSCPLEQRFLSQKFLGIFPRMDSLELRGRLKLLKAPTPKGGRNIQEASQYRLSDLQPRSERVAGDLTKTKGVGGKD